MSDCPTEGPSYRVFFMDDQGRIKKSKALKTCTSDQEATLEAERLVDGRRLELYDGCRLVLSIPGKEAIG